MNTQICVKYEGRNSECTVKPIYQYDVGRQLCVSNIDQNAVIQIHYSISGMAKALTDIPTYNVDNKVWMSNVPNALTMQQNEIQAYVYVTGQNNASITVMRVSIPIKPRAKPDGFQYTEAELKGLDFVLSQLADATKEVNDLKSEVQTAIDGAEDAATNANNAAKNAPYIDGDTGCWMIWDVLTNKYTNTGVPARGPIGETGPTGPTGQTGERGPEGPEGKPGKNFQILGIYDTYENLVSGVTSPSQGDHYDVGPDADGRYTLYMYDTEYGWVNKGVMSGGGGTGDGTVKSVNAVEPDAAGDVSLALNDIKPDPDSEVVDGYTRIPIKADDSDKLGGIAASEYLKKTDTITGGSGVPAGGTAGQTLVKKSETDGDAQWSNVDLSNVTCTDNDVDEVKNVIGVDADTLGGKLPEEYASAEHTHMAADVGALPKNGTAVNAVKLNGKGAEFYATDEAVNDLNQANRNLSRKVSSLLWVSPGRTIMIGPGTFFNFDIENCVDPTKLTPIQIMDTSNASPNIVSNYWASGTTLFVRCRNLSTSGQEANTNIKLVCINLGAF